MSVGEVRHIFISLAHGLPMQEVEQVRALVDRGLQGCAHGRPGSRRQVLLMESEILEQLDVPPGAVKENIVTRGLRLHDLRLGQHLRTGEALLEVTLPCEPCGRMNEIRQGLEQELRGRRGMLCRVVEAGWIRRGDRIEVVNYTRVGP